MSSSSGAGSSAAAPALARGAQRPVSAIPWGDVGAGWFLALWSPAVGRGPGQAPSQPQPTTLYLVDPLGGRYTVASFHAGAHVRLAAWSGDGKRALVVGGAGSTGSDVREVELATGAIRHLFSMDGAPVVITYTLPTGLGVLAGTSTALTRYDTSGTQQQTYPATFPGVGSYQGSAVYTPDGTQLALGAKSGIALVGNDGRLIRALPVPGAVAGCTAERWWQPTVLLASCIGSGPYAGRLWLVPISGAAPTALTAPPVSPDLGDEDAWKLPAGTYVEDTGACGARYVATLGANGRTSPATLPGVAPGESTQIIGADGGRLAVLSEVACGGGTSLMWYDPTADSTTVILGPPLNGGGVMDAIPYPTGDD